jgi:predicted nucleotidyltransferase
MTDLKKGERELVKNILDQFIPNVEIRVFGSRIKGTAKPWSDLDLAIISSAPIDLKLMAEIREAFEISSLPFRVDLLDWNDISTSFQRAIEASGFELL